MNKPLWTAADCGCYADGTYGLDHAADRLRDLLAELPVSDDVQTLIDELDPTSALAYEAADDAVTLLNEYCANGVYFTFDSGNLLLVGPEWEMPA